MMVQTEDGLQLFVPAYLQLERILFMETPEDTEHTEKTVVHNKV